MPKAPPFACGLHNLRLSNRVRTDAFPGRTRFCRLPRTPRASARHVLRGTNQPIRSRQRLSFLCCEAGCLDLFRVTRAPLRGGSIRRGEAAVQASWAFDCKSKWKARKHMNLDYSLSCIQSRIACRRRALGASERRALRLAAIRGAEWRVMDALRVAFAPGIRKETSYE